MAAWMFSYKGEALRRSARVAGRRLLAMKRRTSSPPIWLRFRQCSLAVAVAAVAASVLAGCGTTAPLPRVVGAARVTLSQTAQANLTLDGSTLFGVAVAPIVGKGVFLFGPGLGYEVIDLHGVEHQRLQRMYLAFLPTKVYLEPNAATGIVLPAGKSWISATAVRSKSLNDRFPRLFEQAEGLSPELLLDEILWGADKAARAGNPVVNHVPLSEYVVSVALTRALAAAVGSQGGAVRAAIEEELSVLRSTRRSIASPVVQIKVWVDGPGRIVRLEAAVPGARLGTATMDLSEFGARFAGGGVPPPAQVFDIAGLPRGSGPWVFAKSP